MTVTDTQMKKAVRKQIFMYG